MDATHSQGVTATARAERCGIGSARVFISHPSGNQFFRHLAAALRDADILDGVFTCIDWRGGWGSERLLPKALRTELGRRSFSRELGVPVSSHAWREAGRLAAGRLGWRRVTKHEAGLFSVDAVYRDFDRWVARQLPGGAGPRVVYAYEDAAETTFARAKQEDWRCVYDLPIAYWETSRRLLDEEAVRWPEWEPTLVGTRDSAAKLERKSREFATADLVVCPSRFVAESLPRSSRRPPAILIAPFGSPPTDRKLPRARRPGPLRVLFAGGLTQRKGLADLFAAMRMLRRADVELVVMGTPLADLDFYRRFADFVYEPPRPHREVLALMRTCDVLCLPSIVEGRALVVQEAMSTGMPAIVTPHTGADDVVIDGQTGFVVPIRSPAAIAEKLAWLADHRDAAPELGAAAARATDAYSWANYGTVIIRALLGLQ